MVFGKTKLEFQVGVFTFIGLIILMVFVLAIGRFKSWHSAYRVNIVFSFINGVKVGAPVRFAGVDIGEVKSLEFIFPPQDPDTRVVVKCSVKDDIRIPADSKVFVNTLGLLGEKYVEIMPGADYSKVLNSDDTISGIDPIPMSEVTDMAKSIAGNFNSILTAINKSEGTLGKLIYEDAVYKNVEAFTTDIKNNPWKLFIKGKEKK